MQNPSRVGGGGGSSPLHRVIPGCRRKRTSSRLWKGKQRSCGRQWSNRRQKTTYVSEPGTDLPLESLCGAAPGSSSPVELRGCLLVCQRAGGPQLGVHLLCWSWWAARVGCPSPVLLGALGPGKQGDALQQGQGNPCSWSLTPLCSFSLYCKAAPIVWRQPRSLLPGLRPLQAAQGCFWSLSPPSSALLEEGSSLQALPEQCAALGGRRVRGERSARGQWGGRSSTKAMGCPFSRGFGVLQRQLGGLQHAAWLIASCVWSWQDLREKNWKAMEALATVEKACEEKLLAATKAKVSLGFLLSGDVGGAGQAVTLPRPPKLFALGFLPRLRSSAGLTLLTASPNLASRAA